MVKKITEIATGAWDGLKDTSHQSGEAFLREAKESTIKEAGEQGKKVGPALSKWAKGVLIGVCAVEGAKAAGLSVVIANFMEQFPSVAQWLRPVIGLLSH